MANCERCGREIPYGRICPECLSAIRAAHPVPVQPTGVVRPTPGVRLSLTTILVGINVAVYVAMCVSGVSAVSPTTQQLIHWGANFGPLSLGPQPWRMLTSNYVHIGILHIALNMWCLWSLGKLAERIFPTWTYLVLYTACGLGGSLASLWWHPMVIGAGASGAIFGLAGGLISVFYLGKLPIAPEAVKGTLRSLIAFAGYNLFFGLTAGIDNFAHLGGLLTGLVFGAIVAKHVISPPEERLRWEIYASLAMAVVIAGGIISVRKVHAQVVAGAPLTADAGHASLRNALASLQRGNYDQAIAQLQVYAKANPDEPQPYYLMGVSYMGKHQPDKAIEQFQRALQVDPDFVQAEVGLASAYRAKGMNAEAQDASRRAAEIQQRIQDQPASDDPR